MVALCNIEIEFFIKNFHLFKSQIALKVYLSHQNCGKPISFKN